MSCFVLCQGEKLSLRRIRRNTKKYEENRTHSTQRTWRYTEELQNIMTSFFLGDPRC